MQKILNKLNKHIIKKQLNQSEKENKIANVYLNVQCVPNNLKAIKRFYYTILNVNMINITNILTFQLITKK